MKINIHIVPFEDKDSWIKGSNEFPKRFKEAFEWMEEIEGGFEEELLSFARVKFIEYEIRNEEEMLKKIRKEEGLNIYVCGSHFISYPATRIIKEDFTFIQFDYHPDLRDEYEGRKLSHATMAKRMAEEGREIIQIGIGEQSIEDLFNARKYGILQYFEMPSYEEIKDKIGKDKVYLSLDGDAFKFFKSVSTPSLSKIGEEAFPFIEKLVKEKEIVGMDIVEILGKKRDSMLAAQFIRKIIFFIKHLHRTQ